VVRTPGNRRDHSGLGPRHLLRGSPQSAMLLPIAQRGRVPSYGARNLAPSAFPAAMPLIERPSWDARPTQRSLGRLSNYSDVCVPHRERATTFLSIGPRRSHPCGPASPIAIARDRYIHLEDLCRRMYFPNRPGIHRRSRLLSGLGLSPLRPFQPDQGIAGLFRPDCTYRGQRTLCRSSRETCLARANEARLGLDQKNLYQRGSTDIRQSLYHQSRSR